MGFSFNSLSVSQTNASPCSLNHMLLVTVLTLNPHFLHLLEISTAANFFFLDTHKNSRSRQNGKHLAETQTTDWSHTLVYALMPPSSKIMTLKMFSRYIKPKRTDFSTLFHTEGSVRGVGGERGPGFPFLSTQSRFPCLVTNSILFC